MTIQIIDTEVQFLNGCLKSRLKMPKFVMNCTMVSRFQMVQPFQIRTSSVQIFDETRFQISCIQMVSVMENVGRVLIIYLQIVCLVLGLWGRLFWRKCPCCPWGYPCHRQLKIRGTCDQALSQTWNNKKKKQVTATLFNKNKRDNINFGSTFRWHS